MNCSSGWTSISDHSFGTSGPECLIHYMGVRVLSYFCIVIPGICNILLIGHYICIVIRKKGLITREYKNMFPFFFFIMGSAYSVFGILKIAYPDGQQPLIGRDFSISFALLIADSFCFAGLLTYLQVIIKFLEGYSRMMSTESRERVHERLLQVGFYSWFTLLSCVISGLMPLIAIAYPSHSTQLCMTQLILVGISAILYGLIFCNCLSFLLRELGIYLNKTEKQLQINSAYLKVIIFRLTAAYYAVGAATLLFGIIYIILGSSNFLFHLTTYTILCMYTLAAPITFVLVVTVAYVAQNDEKIMTSIAPA
jgi:hypothetical protein